MKIKGIIFDMDGIITDSETAAKRIMQEILKKHQLPYSDEIYLPLLGINHYQAIEYFNSLTKNEQLSHNLLSEFSEEIITELQQGMIPFKKGAIELINALNSINFPIALATSAEKRKVQASFNGNGIDVPFTHVITGDMVTHSKPNPQIFLLAAQEIKQNIQDCLVIEDSYNGIRAALNAQAIACMVPDILEPTEEMKKQVIIKNDLFEVKKMLEELAIL
ncbi:MAG: HAD family phosphatase [Erysipelotrichia bacterium]|nr:HAD family phosphatase [Erysipelotrichia bacterium]